VGEAVASAGTQVIGGDSSAAGELALTVTVIGSAQRPLLRSGGHAGDRVYVTGRLGGPFAALRALRAGKEPPPEARARFARPEPRLREGQWLAEHGASAAIDISDGLAADLAHVAAASNLRLVVELDQLAVHEEDPRTGSWATVDRPAPPSAALLDAARSGEEYELAVLSSSPLDVRRFEQAFRLPLREIGRAEPVEPGGTPGVSLLARGTRVDLPGGHDHFSR
jgi:thiamine-monophosphate kinase